MTTPLYPSNLPGVSSFRLTPDSQIISSENEQGSKSFRRRTRMPSATASGSFRFLESDYKTFVTWWLNDLLVGHKWFYIQIPSPAGMSYQACRFVRRYTARLQGNRYYEVDFEFEIRERSIDAIAAAPAPAPPPPTGEPDVLVVVYSAGSTSFSGSSPADIYGTSMTRSQKTTSEYATLENSGAITITQAGVYELTIQVTLTSNAFVESKPYVGTNINYGRTIRVVADEDVFNQPQRHDFTDLRLVTVETAPFSFNPAVYGCGYLISDDLAAEFTLVVRRSGDLFVEP